MSRVNSETNNLYHYPRFQRKSAETLSLLCLTEIVVSDTTGCQMASEALNHVRMPLRVMAERLGYTEMGAFFFSWMLNNFNDRHLLVVDLARQLLCSNITILTYWRDIEMLRDLHYIRMGEYNGETFFQVHNDVMEAIRENRAYSAPSYSGLDEDMFLDCLGQLCKNLDGGFLNGTFFLEEL